MISIIPSKISDSSLLMIFRKDRWLSHEDIQNFDDLLPIMYEIDSKLVLQGKGLNTGITKNFYLLNTAFVIEPFLQLSQLIIPTNIFFCMANNQN